MRWKADQLMKSSESCRDTDAITASTLRCATLEVRGDVCTSLRMVSVSCSHCIRVSAASTA